MLFPKCGKQLEKGSLVAHHQAQHSVAKGGLGEVGHEEAGGNDPRTYMVAFTAKVGPRPFPVKGCSGQA